MKLDRKGLTLLEMTFVMGLSLIVLAAGYSAYFSVTRADDVERRRETLTASALNAMAHVKEDVRSASEATASGSTLTLATTDGPVTYRGAAHGTGIERIAGRRRSLFKGATASFARSGAGVDVSIKSRAKVHGRMIRVDLDCFVTPRNR